MREDWCFCCYCCVIWFWFSLEWGCDVDDSGYEIVWISRDVEGMIITSSFHDSD